MRWWLAYFQLARIPAVFSAIADICLGYLLVHPDAAQQGLHVSLSLLVLASCGLYLAGMILNDFFDREIDARERPFRPIPSGRVSPQSALRLGMGLLVLGNIAAGFAGMTSLTVSLALTTAILAYNGGGKQTPIGPILMGTCRGLNVLLGASGSSTLESLWQLPQSHVAMGLGIYIMGVTIFAAQEAEQSSRLKLLIGIGVLNLGLAWLFTFCMNYPGLLVSKTAAIAIVVIAVTINRRAFTALAEPGPKIVQSAVRTMLMSLIMLDAALILHVTASPIITFSVIALLIPAFWLGRYMSIT